MYQYNLLEENNISLRYRFKNKIDDILERYGNWSDILWDSHFWIGAFLFVIFVINEFLMEICSIVNSPSLFSFSMAILKILIALVALIIIGDILFVLSFIMLKGMRKIC